MVNSRTLPIKVWMSSEECEIGVLEFRSDDVILSLQSGQALSGKNANTDILFEILNTVSPSGAVYEKGGSVSGKYKIQLKPDLMIQHQYTNQGTQFIEDIFPPSTAGFYGRLQAGIHNALYTVQPIHNNDLFLLSISNPETGQIYENQVIQPFEAESLAMTEDSVIRKDLFSKVAKSRAKSRKEILKILDSPPPSWEELSKLVAGISIPNLELGRTMGETLTRIIPTSFPEEIREELMVFLAYVNRGSIPTEDPLVYSYRFTSMSILETLLNGHIMHLIDGTQWPPYVQLMTLAERGQLDLPKRAVHDSIKNSPWLLFSIKCAEYLSNWQDIVISSAIELNKSGRIVLGLPTTENSAKKSRKAWKQRFAEMSRGLRVYGHINHASLGLSELIYLGAAYRWPHRHMKFITRLGGTSNSSPHMQVMLVPISVIEQIKRALPSIIEVSWSARTSNLNLFDIQERKWIVSSEDLIDSVTRKITARRLKRNFGEMNSPEKHKLTIEEARNMDLVAEGVDLAFLEIPEFLSNWSDNERRSRQVISSLVKRGIMKISYEMSDSSLLSLAIIAQGESRSLYSLVSSFLTSTPTSYARISKTGEDAVILSRLPERIVYEVASELTSQGIEQGINIRCLRPTTFRRYTSNLYQRLLRENGLWDDNVSAFLSQARSKRKELSEKDTGNPR